MKLLFDLFPVVLFFVAFKLYGIYVATAVAIAATLLQIAWSIVRHRKVDPMLWISFAVVALFGGATLWFHNETFIKVKPTALYVLFAMGLLIAQYGFDKNMLKAMLGKQVELPEKIWTHLNLSWATFFIFLGVLNLVVVFALHASDNAWVNFKLFGCTGLTLVFVVGQSVWLARHIKHPEQE